ncbi:MAG: adenylate/guanylate cyclase domain-containing protein [Spirochaetota bacterium]
MDELDISEAIRQGRGGINDVGREADVTILFSDIRSFTAFSEKALPYDVIHILNRYFETIGSIIDVNGGYIDKYMGDGIMAIFGLDKDMKDDHAYLAVKSSLEIQQAINEFNDYLLQHFNHSFSAGVGIHSGTVIIGNLGFSKKKEYTALGDTVNTASRIESLNKRTGTAILVSESTYKRCQRHFTWGRKFKTKVKGKEEPVVVHEVIDFMR